MAQSKASYKINVVSAPLKLDASPLSDAVVNQPYSTLLKVEGGTPPYAFGIDSGSLPSGLSLDPVSGAITGTPTVVADGTPFEIVVTDQGV